MRRFLRLYCPCCSISSSSRAVSAAASGVFASTCRAEVSASGRTVSSQLPSRTCRPLVKSAPASIIAPISDMKISHLGHHNPRLHSDEVLIALSISAVTNPLAELVLKKLDELRGCDAHFSVILSEEDTKLYNRLGIHVSCEPKYEIKKLYHK